MKQSSRGLIVTEIKRILLAGTVSTQEDIRLHLLEKGLDVNQAKISRVLRKLGAVKVRNKQGDIVYSIPKEPGPPETKSSLNNLILDIKNNENLIVIHTSPGSASLFARLIDHNLEKIGVLGTVAGDDTVIVVPKTSAEVQEITQAVKNLFSQIG